MICYVLLAGYPPFYDEDMKKLFRKIKDGKYHFHQEHWADKSEEAIDIIKRMLCVDVKERWNAQQLLSHPWIQTGDEELANRNIDGTCSYAKFNARRRFKAAASAIILTNRMKKAIDGLTALKKEEEGHEVAEDESHLEVPDYVTKNADSVTAE